MSAPRSNARSDCIACRSAPGASPDTFLALWRARAAAALVAMPGAPGAALIAEPAALALQSDSVDVMLLPHTLEFEPDPHEVLREVVRVLRGEGELLVLGFEPLGSWSLRNAFTRGGCPPGLRRTISESRLADWLKLLGFEVGAAQRFLYAPPLRACTPARRAAGSSASDAAPGRACPAPTCCMRASACIR